MHHKIIFILSLMILSLLLQSCALISDTTSSGTQSPDRFSVVAEPSSVTDTSSISETDPIQAENTTDNTTTPETAAQSEIDEIITREIVYSFYAVIDSIDTFHPSFIVTQTSDASFSLKGSHFSLHITDATKLTAADGTEISISDFDVSDPIGVIIDGLIAETDPASPEYVTLISLLDN